MLVKICFAIIKRFISFAFGRISYKFKKKNTFGHSVTLFMSHFQIENEYGSYFACDSGYMRFLYQKTRTILGDNAIIYTTDGSSNANLKCGTTPGAYATVDFGITGMCRIIKFELQIGGRNSSVDNVFSSLFCVMQHRGFDPPLSLQLRGFFPLS